jgi:menaquinone-9 beta-reductase
MNPPTQGRLRAEYDVIVVGARVAGATVAALVGDAGYRVLLVDRAHFPSDTLSTHFFRGAGLLAVLSRLGLIEQVLALGPPPLRHEYLYEDGGAEPMVGPPQDPGEIGFCLSVRRQPLDHLLVQRATTPATVDFLEATRVTALITEGQRVVGARLAAPSGERAVRTRVVVGADGRHSTVARVVKPALEQQAPAYRALYYCYLRGFLGPGGRLPDGAEFSLIGDELAYVFPSDGGVTCVAMSINMGEFAALDRSQSDWFATRIGNHPGFARRFAEATQVSRLLGCGPEPNFVRVPTGPGWALVGDAGQHQDPWSGIGMDMASTHAAFLSESLIGYLAGETTEDEALSNYRRRRNEHGLVRYLDTVRKAADLRQP